MRNRRIALILGLSLGFAACLLGGGSRDEVGRQPSPSRRLDAVVIETNGGATTSFGYEVHVVQKGQPAKKEAKSEVAFLYGATRSESAYGVKPRWESDSELVIEFFSVKQLIRKVKDVRVAGTKVNVTLRGGVKDPSAPGGGMLYNLRRGAQ